MKKMYLEPEMVEEVAVAKDALLDMSVEDEGFDPSEPSGAKERFADEDKTTYGNLWD